MSYLRLFKVTSDFALGFQTLNQALENNRALYEQLDAKHSVGNTAFGSPDPFLGPGKHDDFRVARTVADFAIDTTTPVPSALSKVSGPMILGAVTYIVDGLWKISMTSPRLFGAIASVRATATADRWAQCRVYQDTQGPYVLVSTWDVGSAALANYDFSLVIWAQGVS
ncbi:MAG TPA: hypothetical protein VGD87_11560 [Archangium sp.]